MVQTVFQHCRIKLSDGVIACVVEGRVRGVENHVPATGKVVVGEGGRLTGRRGAVNLVRSDPDVSSHAENAAVVRQGRSIVIGFVDVAQSGLGRIAREHVLEQGEPGGIDGGFGRLRSVSAVNADDPGPEIAWITRVPRKGGRNRRAVRNEAPGQGDRAPLHVLPGSVGGGRRPATAQLGGGRRTIGYALA